VKKTNLKAEVIAVVGGQWGDEGKGKIVDALATEADVIIRAQGGDNAGHTVLNEQGKFALHLIPAGIFNASSLNIIGAGTALNPQTLLREIKELRARGIQMDNLIISPKAHLAFDYHLYLDREQENARGVRKIETTKRGIGPTYMDKAERAGLQARLLLKPELCLEQLGKVLEQKKKLYNIKDVDEFEVSYYEPLVKEANQILKDMIKDTEEMITERLEKGSRFVIEGAHGALLDLDHGTYPMVTASNSTVGGLLVGAGIPPIKLTKVVGIFKAYQTRVGAGGMPTELDDKQGELIREQGHEYGTTTGRPRRVGYFDGVAARYAHQINGFTDIAITRLDTLAGVGDLKICHKYSHLGTVTNQFNTDNTFLSECVAKYGDEDTFRGWDEEVSGAKSLAELPETMQKYVANVMSAMPGAKATYLGIGPSRNDLIQL
jgi:adenylosuccinate synthase